MARCAAVLASIAIIGFVVLFGVASADGATRSRVGLGPQIAAANLESAAAKAGTIARSVAMSVIGIAFAAAAVILAFRRDFRDAVAAFAVGLVAVLFATPAGVALFARR